GLGDAGGRGLSAGRREDQGRDAETGWLEGQRRRRVHGDRPASQARDDLDIRRRSVQPAAARALVLGVRSWPRSSRQRITQQTSEGGAWNSSSVRASPPRRRSSRRGPPSGPRKARRWTGGSYFPREGFGSSHADG